jgi:ribonuclease M5
MIQEIIVVEGKDDTAAIRRAVDAETIETGGSALNPDVISRIELARQTRGVIIFTDPDHAGERIRKIISNRIPGCKHAFLTQEDAEKKGDIGVENASPGAIRRALEDVKTDYAGKETEIHWEDLIQSKLVTDENAAARRLEMGKILGIGYANGKQFYKRCKMFQISRERFYSALEQLDRRGL